MTNILFIEDEDFTMNPFFEGLKDEEYIVTTAKDGEEALRNLKGGKYNFDLIILDIMLPRGYASGVPSISEDIKTGDMGIEVLRQLRKEIKKFTPVIVLSAVSDDEIKSKVLDLGINRYFTKPISLMVFMDEVKKALSYEGKK